MRTCPSVLVLAALAGCAATGSQAGDFTTTTIHMGIVCSDVARSVAFYRDGLGFTEVKGFDVSAELGSDAGLTDGKPFHVHVLKLADAENATQIKLMQFADARPERVKNDYIHSSLGMRYLTINVKDTTAAVERARKAGAAPLAKGPVLLPGTKGVYLTLVRDPDGNLIELIGPKK